MQCYFYRTTLVKLERIRILALSGIINEFIQYNHNVFQYVHIPIKPTIGDKNLS